MEIDPINNKKAEKELKKKKIKKSKTSNSTVSETQAKEGFFDVLLDAEADISEKELKLIIDNVLEVGNRFAKSPTSSNLKDYKGVIKNFLKRLEKHWYIIKNDVDFRSATPKLHMVAQIVDQKLKDLTDLMLKREKNTLMYASKIEEINGLILDLYK
jgi:hypothetical protein